ncbi:MAG: topoisomerase DNA-binding C4 zinc finger domain-containing protein [Methanosarcinaceae archaeon]|nr:topoisomerase DNA-binding C4 zinc finger domain-containing protein [Methanosarcinaceae archaeon]
MITVVFTEKNKAAAQIASILSSSGFTRTIVEGVQVYEFEKNNKLWRMMGLSGHIMGYDYPAGYNNWYAVDPAVLLDIAPIKSATKKNYVDAIKQLAQNADEIILACDFDREGENIGFEVKSIAENVSKAPVKRARFSSLSAGEINRAFEKLVEPDRNMAMAAEARQILDLKMGATFTRYVTLSVREKARTKDILSIGPCQTPTCGFVYERERAIRDFESKYFWKIEALFNSKGSDFQGSHRSGHITEKAKADAIFTKIRGCKSGTIVKKSVKDTQTNPPYPLNTTEFLKRASRFLGINPEKALEIAEHLYLSGFISYPRTETNRYADDFDFKSLLILLTKGEYAEYALSILSGKIYPQNGKKDAHDHPPIHPIKAAYEKDILKAVSIPHAWDVYDLITRHFLANLMPSAVFEKTHLEISVKDEIFDSSGSVKKYPGWMRVYPFETKNDKLLPLIAVGDNTDIKKLTNTKSRTSPPKKLTEAELLTLMDKHGIGTKATAPKHIGTNKKRGYFENKGKSISILDTGFALMDALYVSVPILVKPDIRARIETLIQEVEDGEKPFETVLEEGTELIKEMYLQLSANRTELISRLAGTIQDEAASVDEKNYVGKCPECGRILRIITTDKGRFIGCTGYPECRNTYPLPKIGALAIIRSLECKKGGSGVLKVGNKYQWAIGVGPCFNCELEKECFPPKIIGACPNCSGKMFLITTKNTRFLGCTYRCGYTESVPKTGRLTVLERLCERCGWHLIRIKEQGKDAIESCVNRKCAQSSRVKTSN